MKWLCGIHLHGFGSVTQHCGCKLVLVAAKRTAWNWTTQLPSITERTKVFVPWTWAVVPCDYTRCFLPWFKEHLFHPTMNFNARLAPSSSLLIALTLWRQSGTTNVWRGGDFSSLLPRRQKPHHAEGGGVDLAPAFGNEPVEYSSDKGGRWTASRLSPQ